MIHSEIEETEINERYDDKKILRLNKQRYKDTEIEGQRSKIEGKR